MNPYDICVANRKVGGHQQTVTWHVDDVKFSHVCKQANKEFIEWCEKKYGSNLSGHIKLTRGKKHEYLKMLLDYSEKGKLKMDMRSYIKNVTEAFPESLSDKVICPWTTRLFKITTMARYQINKRENYSTHM